MLTERLFPERASQPAQETRGPRDEAIIRDLGELAEGAPIVHEDHGVGRYRGLVTLEAGGIAGEYLDIEYAKGDRLYVPVAQLHLVARYSGASPETAPLHSLGGEQWAKAKPQGRGEESATWPRNCSTSGPAHGPRRARAGDRPRAVRAVRRRVPVRGNAPTSTPRSRR